MSVSNIKQQSRRSQPVSSSRRAPHIPIKELALAAGVDPYHARKWLRKAGYKSTKWRWLFTPRQAKEVMKILTAPAVVREKRGR